MIITTSNILAGQTPTISNGNNDANYDPANVTDPDFSTFYQSSDNFRLTFDFGSTGIINYVAYAGVNNEGAKNFTSRMRVRDGDTIIATNFIQRNNCVVITFEPRAFTNLRFGLFNAIGSEPPKVHYVAAGTALTVPNNGEQAGYNRQYLDRNRVNKSSLNNKAAPTSYLTKKVEGSGTLRIPNASRSFSESEWQTFLDFSDKNYFFIREQDPTTESTSNSSAYLCYEPRNIRTTAHSQTRLLNDISISFKVFNGL